MVFALIWDFVFWGHVPGLLSILGTIIIVVNAFIIIKYKPTTIAEAVKGGDAEADGGKYHTPGEIDLDFIITDDEDDSRSR